MPLLIDGYNLLHVSGILGRRRGPAGFHASRVAMLNFLAESLDPGEAAKTTVVFDAGDPPWGLPRRIVHRGITVHFASNYGSADELIEELIAAASAPRRLVVVSSDHRIQRAARRRRAKAIDSDVWYAELVRARRQRHESATDAPIRPSVPLLAEDVDYWLRQFGGESAFDELLAKDNIPTPPKVAEPPTQETHDDPENRLPPDSGLSDNPFPPGYGEDLLEGEGL